MFCLTRAICNIISSAQRDYKNHVKSYCKSKIQYKYSSNNCIPELLTAKSVADDEFLLEWCEYFGQLQVWYINVACLDGML